MAWDEVLGHDLAKRLFQAHLASGCVPSAYLLSGPEGVGKRRLALEMAKALNCADDGPRPCDRCDSCTQIARRVHPDVHLLVPGGASEQIRIEDIRHLLGRIALRPFRARIQVGLIDGAERLTEEAANSLLKALEEPPQRARFLLITAHLSDCLPTIVSRCQLIRCQPLPLDAVAQVLGERSGCDATRAQALARLSGGRPAHALRLAERWTAYEPLLERMAGADTSAWLTQPLPETRQDLTDLLDLMMRWLRDLAVTAAGGSRWVVHGAYEESLRRQAQRMDLERCVDTAFELVELRESVEQFANPRLIATLAREKWLLLQKANER